MRRPWLTSLATLSSATMFVAMVGCTAHHCSPYKQLFPVKQPLPHHHTYVPNEPLPYQTSPFCHGYYPTCWRAWPEQCVACPAPAACDDVVIEDRAIESIETIPTPPAPVMSREYDRMVPSKTAPSADESAEGIRVEKPSTRVRETEDRVVEEPSADAPGVEVEPLNSPEESSVDLVPAPKSSKPAPTMPPEPDAEQRRNSPNGSDRAPPQSRKGPTVSDDVIAQRVVDRLESQKAQGTLADFDIEVQVVEGVVTLVGEVTSTKQQLTVLVATRKAPGVKKIINGMTVAR